MLFWNTAPSGSSASNWVQVMREDIAGQVATVLEQYQPKAPLAVPSWVSTTVQVFSAIGV